MVTNGSEHETRSRHVEMNGYETVANGSEHETRSRHVEMNECETVTNGSEHETRSTCYVTFSRDIASIRKF